MMKEFQDIQKIKEKQSKLKKKIEHQKRHVKHVPIAAFVTFETQQERNDAYMKFHKSHFSRVAFRIFPSFYRKDVNVFQGNYLKVKAAPSTDNLLWANIGVSKFQKFLRRILSWIITIGFWAISKFWARFNSLIMHHRFCIDCRCKNQTRGFFQFSSADFRLFKLS